MCLLEAEVVDRLVRVHGYTLQRATELVQVLQEMPRVRYDPSGLAVHLALQDAANNSEKNS